ncbi:MAG: substrate-binding domain-containing protein, partial [bacterium]|nr:substrate-binding domain-containing protein [bacterium]
VGRGSGCAIRIAGLDDHPWSRFTCPPLTTISLDYAAIVERSVLTLFRVIESGGKAESRETTLFEGKLVLRASA